MGDVIYMQCGDVMYDGDTHNPETDDLWVCDLPTNHEGPHEDMVLHVGWSN